MFTGIVEETGTVRAIRPSPEGRHLEVQADRVARDLRPGHSLAVNGCCLTATRILDHATVRFDLLGETWDTTNFRFLSAGDLVNLERPLAGDGRLGGHIVTGHVAGTAKVTRWFREGRDHCLEVIPPTSLLRYIVVRGSVALDGISLTVAAVLPTGGFRTWITPHTLAVTNLGALRTGDSLNLETDILARHVERLLEEGNGEKEWCG